MSSYSILLNALIVALLGALYLLKRRRERGHGDPGSRPMLPPGPKGLPLLGNLFDMPKKDEYLVFSQWHKTYGDICSVTVLGQPVIIVNSIDKACSMLNRQIYSARPYYTMACDLVGWEHALVLLPYGERLKAYRKMLHSVIGTRANVDKFRSTIESEAHLCLSRLLDSKNGFNAPIRRAIGATLLMITHGYKVRQDNDRLIRVADEATDQLGILLLPGMFLVDSLPFLKHLPAWFPGAGFKTLAQNWRRTLHGLVDQSYDFVIEQMARGNATPCFVTDFVENKTVTEQEEVDVKWAATSIYLGGADMASGVSAVSTLILAMTMYPEVQKKAQAELDSVVGQDRLPQLSDRDHLPYINAMLRETIRWGPPVPLGAPHCVTEDDVYDGYLIPKGSVVVANLWHILQDPTVYPDPEVYRPERFLPSEGERAQSDPLEVGFGFGRRACPGVHLSEASLFIFTATLLSVFKMEKVIENGIVQEPKHEFTSGVLIRPKPFKTSFKPRSAKAEALIRMVEDC
ncbi:hypothetical protein EW146_g7925 [Bondarzewia mesenterica]|uniref:Cytochrome P450 n=1 Tax=Bondarzewia mesenterica TaxID=1095465 RepID=A0A4S4LIZ2_9AGAM|nr:hypothetical protein EW146_g7925 [Bondarzewia mesenterica]